MFRGQRVAINLSKKGRLYTSETMSEKEQPESVEFSFSKDALAAGDEVLRLYFSEADNGTRLGTNHREVSEIVLAVLRASRKEGDKHPLL